MEKRRLAVRLLEAAIFMGMMSVVIQLSIALGIEEKSWWEISWEFIIGGGFGLIAGITFFVIFGTIGWVCGPIFGAIGLFGLMVGGALGGLGLGAVANIIRNPSDYNFNWLIILVTLLIGGIFSKYVSAIARRKIEKVEIVRKLGGGQLLQNQVELDVAQEGDSASASSPPVS